MFALALAAPVSAQNSGKRDCDANAVIHCGALTTNELQRKYRSRDDVKPIFNHFGISNTEINRMNGQNTRHGHVTKDGRVIVNGEVVARNATTAGRQHMPGSKKVTSQGTTFYTRAPGVSFSEEKLDALVVMKDGRFQYAVLTSCGNPVKAVPVAKPKQPAREEVPQPAPAPPPPAPAMSQSQTQVQTTEVNQTVITPPPPAPQPVAAAPAPQPQPQPAPQPQGKALPDTGAGAVLGASALVTVGSTFAYAVYIRLRSIFL